MFDVLLPTVLLLIALPVAYLLRPGSGPTPVDSIAIGVVRRIAEEDCGDGVGIHCVTVDVDMSPGRTFAGRLTYRCGDPAVSALRPGIPVLVAFDPAAPEQLSFPDQTSVVRAALDRPLVRTHGVVTAVHVTGRSSEQYREVKLDLVVSRPGGGQFPAHHVTLVQATALDDVAPGSVVQTYYHSGDESTVTVCVPPA